MKRLLNSINAMILADFYKVAHRAMYPGKTETVYSTFTPRASRVDGVNEVVYFGGQMFLKNWAQDFFNEYFFGKSEEEVVANYSRFVKYTLGDQNPQVDHIRDLHRLGYLPVSVKTLPEGSIVPLKVPFLTIENTDPRFFWVTNFLETLMSAEMWGPITSATIAREYRKTLDAAAMETVGDTFFSSNFQGHDFSMRGMFGVFAGILSGAGHLTAFTGTDTMPAISAMEALYNANIEKELVGTSIPASEHSIQCAYGNDMEYYKRMITEVHTSGPVSLVSDGYDYWGIYRDVLPALKQTIMARKGHPLGLDKLVVRPDSGDPVKIVCGDPNAIEGSLEYKGSIEALWDIFGGTVSAQGYKVLDSHIGLIYGDSITPARAKEIVTRLKAKGFASTNVVFGIGSFTYQFNTRDTFGMAIKATSVTINGTETAIFKDPKTDDGTKKSAKGRVAVVKENGSFSLIQNLTSGVAIAGDELVEVFRDGKLLVDENLSTIRARIYNKG